MTQRVNAEAGGCPAQVHGERALEGSLTTPVYTAYPSRKCPTRFYVPGTTLLWIHITAFPGRAACYCSVHMDFRSRRCVSVWSVKKWKNKGYDTPQMEPRR